MYGSDMDKDILAAPFRGNETVAFGLVKKFYCAIPAHEKKAPTLITVQREYAAGKVLQQGVSRGGVCHLIFARRSHKLGRLSLGRLS